MMFGSTDKQIQAGPPCFMLIAFADETRSYAPGFRSDAVEECNCGTFYSSPLAVRENLHTTVFGRCRNASSLLSHRASKKQR